MSWNSDSPDTSSSSSEESFYEPFAESCHEPCDKKGQQGFVTMRETVIEKKSRRVDYTIELEYAVGMLINTLNSEHFCKCEGITWKDNAPILKMEKISGDLLAELVLNSDKQCSIIGRTLSAIAIINEEFGISHNDLHTSNVMVRSTDADVQSYIFRNGEELAFETYGLSPVVIDFGLAFPGMAAKGKMKTEIIFNDIGYFPYESDSLSDARRLIFTADNIPQYIKDELTCKHVTPAGWFEEETFPNIIKELINSTRVNIHSDKLTLFAAHIKLPLRFNKRCGDFDVVLSRLDATLSIADIKHLLDNNRQYLRKKFSLFRFMTLRKQCKNVVLAINNVVCKLAIKSSKLKNELYNPLHLKSARDVARVLMENKEVKYTTGMTVSIYHVESRKTKIVVLTENDVALLSSGKTLQQVFP